MQATDIKQVYAAGTAYQLTTTSAALDFGTTDPSVTLNAPGTWLIFSRAVVKFNAATFAATKNATIKLRRTNNTAGDITGASTVLPTGVTSTTTGPLGNLVVPPILYTTTNSGDIISLFGSIETAPSAGSIDVTEAEIIAIRIF